CRQVELPELPALGLGLVAGREGAVADDQRGRLAGLRGHADLVAGGADALGQLDGAAQRQRRADAQPERVGAHDDGPAESLIAKRAAGVEARGGAASAEATGAGGDVSADVATADGAAGAGGVAGAGGAAGGGGVIAVDGFAAGGGLAGAGAAGGGVTAAGAGGAGGMASGGVGAGGVAAGDGAGREGGVGVTVEDGAPGPGGADGVADGLSRWRSSSRGFTPSSPPKRHTTTAASAPTALSTAARMMIRFRERPRPPASRRAALVD